MLLSEHSVSSSWHPTKNQLLLAGLTTQSGRRVWWMCPHGHEWECRIADRIATTNKNGTECPFCAGRRVLVGFNDLASLRPEIADQWHPNKNGDNDPSQFTVGSHRKVWWLCELGHEWETAISHRTGNKMTGCVYCAGNKAWQGFNDLATINPALSAQWHPVKNGDLLPSEVTSSSHRKVWWLGNCGHEWESSSASRKNGSGCPICSGRVVLLGFNDLASQYPDVAATWHPTKNGDSAPEKVHMTTHSKYWWQCNKDHEWQAVAFSRTKGNKRCPICYGLVVVAGFNDLASQYPHFAAEWHPAKNGDKQPHEVYAGGKKKAWWQCPKGHEWESLMESRITKGTNCPPCWNNTFISKAEQELADFLTDEGYAVKQSERSIFKNRRELDIYIPSHKVAIEFNGMYFHSEEMGKYELYHKEKWAMCAEKSIELLQIWEDDWNAESEKIKRMILKHLRDPQSLDIENYSVMPCSSEKAAVFMKTHSTDLVQVGDMSFQCRDLKNEIVAMLSILREGDGSIIIRGYADSLSFISSELLLKMMSEIDSNYGNQQYRVIADNCSLEHRVFEGAGFIHSKSVPPTPSVMKRKIRTGNRIAVEVSSDGYSYTDKDGISHPVAKKKLIWDAGKTVWEK